MCCNAKVMVGHDAEQLRITRLGYFTQNQEILNIEKSISLRITPAILS